MNSPNFYAIILCVIAIIIFEIYYLITNKNKKTIAESLWQWASGEDFMDKFSHLKRGKK